MSKEIQVGDLVIYHGKLLRGAMVGRPALILATHRSNYCGSQYLRLKVGEVEWWEHSRYCEKVRD